MSRHDDLTAFTCGEPPQADHPALMKVYRLAAKCRLPVLIHHNISSANRRDPIYMVEMEHALKTHPETTFIWAHVGMSRRVDVPTLAKDADRLLSTCPNLNFDLSWVVYDEHIAISETSLKEWAALVEKHPNRFMIGSDKVGHWSTCQGEMARYNRLLKKLTPKTTVKLSRDNIRRLVPKNGAIRH